MQYRNILPQLLHKKLKRQAPRQTNLAFSNSTVAQQLQNARMLKLALDYYEINLLNKIAAPKGSWFSNYSSRKSGTTSILSQILSFVFRAIIASAGLMVAGDAMNHFLNRPNALDNSVKDGKPSPKEEASSFIPSTNNLSINPSYQNITKNSNTTNWIENITNNASNISQMLLSFAKDVYQNINNYDSLIQANPYFQNLVETIAWYNHESPGSPTVFIPKMFTTKKQLVDQFMNDVAEKIPATSLKG